jgi:hypothetical protein
MAASRHVVLQLPAGHDAVPAARRAFAPFAEDLSPGWFFDASVSLAELVTKAVVSVPPARRTPLACEISLARGVLRVAVERPAGAGEVGPPLASRSGADGDVLWFECDVAVGG